MVWNNESSLQRRFEENLARLLSLPGVPSTIVIKEEFRQIIRDLDASVNVIDRRSAKERLHAMADSKRASIMKHLAGKEVCAIVDIWSSSLFAASFESSVEHSSLPDNFPKLATNGSKSKKSFLGVSVSYEDNGNVKTVVLKLAPFPHPHSAKRLRELSFDVLREFGVASEKVVKFVGDCAPINRAAFRYTVLLASHPSSRS